MRFGRTVRRFAVAVLACAAAAVFPTVPAGADGKRDAQWYLTALRVADAQRISRGAGVTVAVIDTGVWAGHPDLNGAVLPGTNILGDGGDGRQDLDGHGTAIAGIIAARGRGGSRGLLGIAPEAKVLPIRPYDGSLIVTKAINWAVANGARVINMSFNALESDTLATAVKAAAAADAVLVAASGNDGDKGFKGEYPAAYPEVIAVGSVDRNGALANGSHRGPQVDLVAPGVDIPVLMANTGSGYYALGNGTSASSAVVAGAAALVRAKYPDMSAADVVRRLESTAVDKGPPGRDDAYGYGELDLMAALTAPIAAEPSAEPSAGATAALPPPTDREEGSTGGVWPLVILGAGVMLLAGAVIVLVVMLRRTRRA
jgi:type VII secretion-associated serine protease mycosin